MSRRNIARGEVVLYEDGTAEIMCDTGREYAGLFGTISRPEVNSTIPILNKDGIVDVMQDHESARQVSRVAALVIGIQTLERMMFTVLSKLRDSTVGIKFASIDANEKSSAAEFCNRNSCRVEEDAKDMAVAMQRLSDDGAPVMYDDGIGVSICRQCEHPDEKGIHTCGTDGPMTSSGMSKKKREIIDKIVSNYQRNKSI